MKVMLKDDEFIIHPLKMSDYFFLIVSGFKIHVLVCYSKRDVNLIVFKMLMKWKKTYFVIFAISSWQQTENH